jgi:hypothetical protein
VLLLALEQWRDQPPNWLQRLAERPSWLWNTGIGLLIGLSLLSCVSVSHGVNGDSQGRVDSPFTRIPHGTA